MRKIKEEKGRVVFVAVAIMILLFTSLSAAYLTGNKIEPKKNKKIEFVGNLAKGTEDDIRAQIYYIAAEEIKKGSEFIYNISEINENVWNRVDAYLAKAYPKYYGEVKVEVLNSSVFVYLSERNTFDIVPGDNSLINGEYKQTSYTVYFDIIGSVGIRVYDSSAKIGVEKAVALEKKVESAYPFILSALEGLTKNSLEGGEIERIVQYILLAVAQMRVMNGTLDVTKVITKEDVEKALFLAILLQQVQTFRTYDKKLADRIGATQLIKKYVGKGILDPAGVYALFTDSYMVDLSEIISQNIYGLLDYYVLFILDYLNPYQALEDLLAFFKVPRTINIETKEGNETVVNEVKWTKYLGSGFYDIIANALTDAIRDGLRWLVDKMFKEDKIIIAYDEKSNISYLEQIVKKIKETINERINATIKNIDEPIKRMQEMIANAIDRVFGLVEEGVDKNASVSGKNIFQKLVDGIKKAVASAIKGFINGVILVSTKLLYYPIKALLESIRFMVLHQADEILATGNVSSYIYRLNLVKEPFKFWEGDYETALKEGKVRTEEFTVSAPKLQPNIKIKTTGTHYTSVIDKLKNVWNALINGKPSEILNISQPYQTIFNITIEGEYDINVSCTSKIFPKNGIYVGTVVDTKNAIKSIKLSLSFNISLYSGIALDDPSGKLVYKASNTIVGDIGLFLKMAWEGIKYFIKHPIEAIKNVMRLVSSVQGRLAGMMSLVTSIIKVLDKPYEIFKIILRQAGIHTGWSIINIIMWIAKKLNITKFEFDLIGLHFIIEWAIMGYNTMQVMIQVIRGNTFGFVINLVKRPVVNGTSWKDGFEFTIGGWIRIGNLNISVAFDPLMSNIFGSFARITGIYLKPNATTGWRFDIFFPMEEKWKELEFSLRSLFGITPMIPTPIGMLAINLGLILRIEQRGYEAAVNLWRAIRNIGKFFWDAITSTYKMLVDTVKNFCLASITGLAKFVYKVWNNVMRNINEILIYFETLITSKSEVEFFLEGTLQDPSGAAKGGAKISVVITRALELLFIFIQKLLPNFIKKFLNSLGLNTNIDLGKFAMDRFHFRDPNIDLKRLFLESVYLRVNIFVTVGTPSVLQQAIGSAQVALNIRIGLNIPTIGVLLGKDWGNWSIEFGGYFERRYSTSPFMYDSYRIWAVSGTVGRSLVGAA
ncbi:MAG: hypothetical protein AB1779_03435 [Candidatus Thermoplasmatota archaeon]